MKRLLFLALVASPVVAYAAETTADVAAEVEKGVTAYNARDIKYYEASLAPEAVYIAEDGAVIAGKERVVRLFTRIFAATPPRQIAVSDVATGAKGDVAWARFKWTLTIGPEVRKGVATTLFTRAAGAWQVAQIQNTPDGHAMAGGHGAH